MADITTDELKSLYGDLRTLVDYVYEDEKKSWEEDGQPEHHIFPVIERLNKMLERIAELVFN